MVGHRGVVRNQAAINGIRNVGVDRAVVVCPIDATQWTTATWKALGFSITDPHYFRYTFTSTAGTPKTFTALAEADLDCDGILSSFLIYGEDSSQNEVLSSGAVIKNRPLE